MAVLTLPHAYAQQTDAAATPPAAATTTLETIQVTIPRPRARTTALTSEFIAIKDRCLTLLHASRRSLYGRSEANLPSRFLDELPAECVERERLAPASWSSYGARPAPREFAPRAEVPSLSTGDAVRHQTLGAGIVTRIEADGVVTVRFEDGSERRLMLEYAPLERIAG